MTGFDKFGDLLQQEVSRKEFLRYAGVAVLGLIGVTGMLNSLRSIGGTTQHQQTHAGYGASSYGR